MPTCKKRLHPRRRFTAKTKLEILREFHLSGVYEKNEVLYRHKIGLNHIRRWEKSEAKLAASNPDSIACTDSGSLRFDELDKKLFEYCLESRYLHKKLTFRNLIHFSSSNYDDFNILSSSQMRTYIKGFVERNCLGAKNYAAFSAEMCWPEKDIVTPDSRLDTVELVDGVSSFSKKFGHSNLLCMEYFPFWFKVPEVIEVQVDGSVQSVKTSCEQPTRIGIVIGAAANGSTLNPYVIYPSSGETYSKYTAENEDDVISCGIQKNSFLDNLQFYNWIQSVFRPFSRPKRKPHHLIVSEQYETATFFCKKQLDKCQSKVALVPAQVLRLIHPFHLSIINKMVEDIEDNWNTWIFSKVNSLILSSFPVLPSQIPLLYTEESSSNSSEYSPKMHPTPDSGSPYPTPKSMCALNEPSDVSGSFQNGLRYNSLAEELKTDANFFKKPHDIFIERAIQFELKVAILGEESIVSISLPHATVLDWALQAWKRIGTAEVINDSFKRCKFI